MLPACWMIIYRSYRAVKSMMIPFSRFPNMPHPDTGNGEQHTHSVDFSRSAIQRKLATPDVTIADLIGDLDPIKAAKRGIELSSEVIHYGLLPAPTAASLRSMNSPICLPKFRWVCSTSCRNGMFRFVAIPSACRWMSAWSSANPRIINRAE